MEIQFFLISVANVLRTDEVFDKLLHLLILYWLNWMVKCYFQVLVPEASSKLATIFGCNSTCVVFYGIQS